MCGIFQDHSLNFFYCFPVHDVFVCVCVVSLFSFNRPYFFSSDDVFHSFDDFSFFLTAQWLSLLFIFFLLFFAFIVAFSGLVSDGLLHFVFVLFTFSCASSIFVLYFVIFPVRFFLFIYLYTTCIVLVRRRWNVLSGRFFFVCFIFSPLISLESEGGGGFILLHCSFNSISLFLFSNYKNLSLKPEWICVFVMRSELIFRSILDKSIDRSLFKHSPAVDGMGAIDSFKCGCKPTSGKDLVDERNNNNQK